MTAKLNRAFAPVLGAMALSLAPHLYAAPCEVASDPAGDSLQPLLDIVSVSMETSNGRLITVVELSTDAMLGSGLSDVSVNFNERRFVRAFLDAPTLYAYDYGAYESDGTTVSRTSEGDAEGSVNGAVITIDAPLNGVNVSGGVTVVAETAQGVISGFDVTEPAPYAIGSSCSRSLQGELSAAQTNGVAPFEAAFDASRSAGDSVSAYVFDFGDGSAPVTSQTPHLMHTYAQAGDYTATMTPVNASGQLGQTATTAVTVQAPAGAGGALGFGALLALGLMGLRKRRR